MSVFSQVLHVHTGCASRINETETVYSDSGHVVDVRGLLGSEVGVLHLLTVVSDSHVGTQDMGNVC